MSLKLNTVTFIERARTVHGEVYDYDQSVFTTVNNKITITCKKHGAFLQVASSHLKGRGCYKCGRENAKQTCIAKYGSSTPFQSQLIQQQVADTIKTKYRVTSTAILPEIAAKRRATNQQKYGVDFPLENESIKQRTTDTLVARYGVELPGSAPEIRARISDTNMKLYGGITPFSSADVQCTARATMLSRYGKENFHQLDESVQQLLDNREWLETEHASKSLTEISKQLGISDSTVGKYLRQHKIPLIRHSTSTGENQICEFLSANGVEFLQSNRTIISPYELDIYIPEHQLAIEYCGLYWHGERFRSRSYHEDKLKKTRAQSVSLITIFEDEWINSPEIVQSKILHRLGLNKHAKKIYARNCTIELVSAPVAREFLNKYHIQGYGKGFTVGLFHDTQLVAVTVFQQHETQYTLARYATACIVVGGLSKLIANFCKSHPDWSQLISFADLRWSEGELYEKTGWHLDKVIPPDYAWTNGSTRWHKSNFRHSQLRNKLPEYNPSLTEVENCHAAGLLRIYDCGKNRYVLNNPVYLTTTQSCVSAIK